MGASAAVVGCRAGLVAGCCATRTTEVSRSRKAAREITCIRTGSSKSISILTRRERAQANPIEQFPAHGMNLERALEAQIPAADAAFRAVQGEWSRKFQVRLFWPLHTAKGAVSAPPLRYASSWY